MENISNCPLCQSECFLVSPQVSDINYHVSCPKCGYCGVKRTSEKEAIESHNLIARALNNASVSIGKKQK